MVLEMIDHLASIQIRNGRGSILSAVCTHCSIETGHVITYSIALSLVLLGPQSLVADSIRHRLPFQVEHGVHRLDLDPPAAPFQGFSDQSGVISTGHNELITVFDIGILEGNLRLLLLFAVQVRVGPFALYYLSLLDLNLRVLLWIQHLDELLGCRQLRLEWILRHAILVNLA